MRAPGGANMRTVAEPPGAQGGRPPPPRTAPLSPATLADRRGLTPTASSATRPEILAAWHQLLVSILGTGGVDPQLKMLAF